MNHVFEPILRKFLLVFFEDILIYRYSWNEHLLHLEIVFAILQHQQLDLKQSKCTFGATKIEYLDRAKIKAMELWRTPTSQKQLCSFLSMANYYRHFIQWYNIIARPLTLLLHKDEFI